MASTTAAERNVEMTRKGYTAFNEARIEEAMETIADSIVWHVGGDNPLTGDYKGKAAVLEFFMRFGQLTEGTAEHQIHDVLANDEHTVTFVGVGTENRPGVPASLPSVRRRRK